MYVLKDPIGDTIPARRPALAILSHAAEVPAPDLAVARPDATWLGDPVAPPIG